MREGGSLNISKTLVSLKWSLVVKITVPLCTHFFFSFEWSDFLIFEFCGTNKKSPPVNRLHKSNNNNNNGKTTIMAIHSSRPTAAVYTDRTKNTHKHYYLPLSVYYWTLYQYIKRSFIHQTAVVVYTNSISVVASTNPAKGAYKK